MKRTIVEKVNEEKTNQQIMKKAAEVLKKGGLVAFPTETVYGLGANALDPEAVKGIFAAKGRPSDNPLIVHIGDIQELDDLVEEIPGGAKLLMDAFWPGPLTLIFKRSKIIPDCITGGLSTVAVRLPENPIARQLISTAGIPVAAPSANVSGRPSPTQAKHVIEDLSGKIDMIIDGGATEIGLESTVLDLTGDIPMILRPGGVTKEMLEELIPHIEVDPSIVKGVDSRFIPKAPGMKYKHYAPKAKVTIIEGNIHKVIEWINGKSYEMEQKGYKVGVMATEQTKEQYSHGTVISVGDREFPKTIATHLFEILRKFDELGVDLVYAEGISHGDIGMAIMNRLEKAAGYEILHIE